MKLNTSPTQTYLAVFDDGQESQIEAIDDNQAIGLAQKQYANHKWQLFRVNGGERVMVCDQSPECSDDEEMKENVH